MCNCCNSFFCGIANALDNLFASPASSCGCGCNGGGNTGCGCSGGATPLSGMMSNLFQSGCGCNSGCNGGGNGCGCGYDVYYARQYALGPFGTGCGICGY